MTKKRFLLALALMLTAVGGAWAQGELSESFTVTSGGYSENVSFTGTHFSITGSEGDDGGLYLSYATVSVSSLNGENISRVEFHLSTGEAVAQSITTTAGTNSCTNGNANGSITGINATSLTLSTQLDGYVAVEIDQITVYYAPPAGTLVEDGNNHWHLTTPAGNVTLTVTYYGQYRLDSIPQGWQVKVNGSSWNDSLKTYTEGNPQMRYIAAINETDSVELLPPDSLKDVIKSVTLVEVVAAPQLQTLQVGGDYPGTFYYLPGETWEQALQNHYTENNTSGWATWDIYVFHGEYILQYTNGSDVNSNTPIDPSAQYQTVGF